MQHIAVFASGAGSNAQHIIRHFEGHPSIRVACVLTDNPVSPVLDIAARAGIPARYVSRADIRTGTAVLDWLKECRVGWIALAGFLSLIPPHIVAAYPRRMVNIHPALLPRFGGKGMYGLHVHRAVLDAGAAESGITIHFVNERYDEGQVIFQDKVAVDKDETPDSLMAKVRRLEWKHYPAVLEKLIAAAA
jgi:phosphoribosylglycinamide formyltransferase-1